MTNQPVIGFYGSSDTGKTTIIVKLVKRLIKEGFKVATIKKTDKKIGIDVKGKDTWKHSQAGAKLVVLSSPSETDFIIKKYMKTKDIIRGISELGFYDIVLVEGASDPSIPKIKLGNIKERENTIGHFDNNRDEISKLIKKEIDKKHIEKKLNVSVNGKNVPITEFPADFIKSTIVGMLKSLKGVNKIEEVEIHFRI